MTNTANINAIRGPERVFWCPDCENAILTEGGQSLYGVSTLDIRRLKNLADSQGKSAEEIIDSLEILYQTFGKEPTQ